MLQCSFLFKRDDSCDTKMIEDEQLRNNTAEMVGTLLITGWLYIPGDRGLVDADSMTWFSRVQYSCQQAKLPGQQSTTG